MFIAYKGDFVTLNLWICLGILTYASFLDWRYREIDDKTWIIMIILGVIFLFYEFVRTRAAAVLVEFLISVGLATVLAVLLDYLEVMGGGDGKILIGIAALVPSLGYPTLTVFPFFFFSVFFGNAVVMGALLPAIFFIINLNHLKDIRSFKGFLALFIGYEKDAIDVDKFEAIIGKNGNWNLKADRDALGEKIEGVGKVWVTPAIPFVILITVGFLISVIYGDILSLLMLRLF